MSSQPGRTVRVVVRQPQNADGTEQEVRTFEDALVGSDGAMRVYSNRPPEEVFAFGLTLGPGESFVQAREVKLVLPSERNITSDREDGLCVYCQLILHPDAPEYGAHQPCLGLLINNWDRCFLCKFINTSIFQACPDLKARVGSGEVNAGSTDTCITVQSRQFDTFSWVVATVGDLATSKVVGSPIVWTTGKKLGPLGRRRIWESYYTREPTEEISRLNVIKQWLGDCKSHELCNRASIEGGRPLPTRVLQITPQNAEIPFTIQLHESNSQSAPYIALSHCWGQSGPLRTLKSNIERHKRNIPFEDLPLSFRDVVAKVWYLGFTYLWIDSLCIVQDDSADWEAEAARMSDVYSNATLTFAATEAADPTEGCQPMYSRAYPVPLEGDDVALVRFQDHHDLDGRNAPLNKRGWTFQEAALSRRMVCFDNNQMLWKCSSRHESEDGLRVIDNPAVNMGEWNLWACLPRLAGGEQSYVFWYRMMENYSRRELTFEKDKLPALAGIVEAFRQSVGDTPLLGLWRADLLRGLLWRAEKPAERATPLDVAPSWSWTSVGGEVSWADRTPPPNPPGEQLEVIAAEVTWSGTPMTSPIASAVLRVRGRLKAARAVWTQGSLVYLHEVGESPDPAKPHMVEGWHEAASTEPEILGFCHLDLTQPPCPRVWCLEVHHGLQHEGQDYPRNHAHQVLVVEALDEELRDFRRLGVGCVWKHSYLRDGSMDNAVKETFRDTPRRTITIV